MEKNSALLSIGAALVLSLFFSGVGHAFQIEKRQDGRILMAGDMKGPANSAATQGSNTPTVAPLQKDKHASVKGTR